MKKIFYKNLKRYEDIEGLSAAMSYARGGLKKIHQYFNQPMADAIKKVVE